MTTKSATKPSVTKSTAEESSTAKSASTKTAQSATAQSWIYSDVVKEHFLNPRNFLMGDESKYNYDAKGIVGNPICGDQMLMFIQVGEREAEKYIKDVKWKTYGCASAIASTSALSELAKGRTLDEAEHITAEEIEEYLGGLPKHKFHCSVLGHEALAAAIKNYRDTH